MAPRHVHANAKLRDAKWQPLDGQDVETPSAKGSAAYNVVTRLRVTAWACTALLLPICDGFPSIPCFLSFDIMPPECGGVTQGSAPAMETREAACAKRHESFPSWLSGGSFLTSPDIAPVLRRQGGYGEPHTLRSSYLDEEVLHDSYHHPIVQGRFSNWLGLELKDCFTGSGFGFVVVVRHLDGPLSHENAFRS